MSSLTQSRILVISPNWIGDAVMAQPLLTLLKRGDPTVRIDVLAPTPVAPVWRAMEQVESVIESHFRHGALQLRERMAQARILRQRNYACAYVLPNTFKFGLIPWLAGIPLRIGYRGEMRYGLLNVMHRDARDAPRPMLSFYAALASAPSVPAPLPSDLPLPALSVSEDQKSAALAQFGLVPDGPLIAFAPGAEFGSAKRWPADGFAALANTVLLAHPDARIVLLGSGKDRAVCEEIVALAPAAQNLAGATSLDQAIALIAGATAVVSNDSGLMHVAAALQRPLVAIYGPTSFAHTPPVSPLAQVLSLRLDCAPCQQRECPLGHHRCMRDISADRVWRVLQPML